MNKAICLTPQDLANAVNSVVGAAVSASANPIEFSFILCSAAAHVCAIIDAEQYNKAPQESANDFAEMMRRLFVSSSEEGPKNAH